MMSDLFEVSVMADKVCTEKDKSSKKETSATDACSKPSTSKGSEPVATAKKISGTQASIDKLSEIMLTGFQNMQHMFQGCMGQHYDDEMDEEEIDPPDLEDDGNDLFLRVTQEADGNVSKGPEVVKSLANLANASLRKKVDLADKIFEQYLIPKNVEFANTPQINRPVWVNLPHASKRLDVNLQTVQKKILHSAMPIMKVMEQLNEARDDPASLNLCELVKTLTHSLSFIGAANVDMVTFRRSCIKKDLPNNMQLLCSDSVDFSGDFLFGNSLSSDIKEVTELNKISQSLRGGHHGNRARGRNFPRFIRGQNYSRVRRPGRIGKPFVPGRSMVFKRGPLNRSRPSN